MQPFIPASMPALANAITRDSTLKSASQPGLLARLPVTSFSTAVRFPYAMRFGSLCHAIGFNRASIFVLLETDPVNPAGQQSSQPQSALLLSEHNEYWTAKSQLPGTGAMKTMVTGNAFSKAKAACTMQHAPLSMMQGCQAGSLSALEGNQPQSLYC